MKIKKYRIGVESRGKGFIEVSAINAYEAKEKAEAKSAIGQINWGKEETVFESIKEIERFEFEERADLKEGGMKQ